MINRNHGRDIILGVAVGDALGVPVEFQSREVLNGNPVRDMREYGTYQQPKGTWSDDSSLTFCLAESLIDGFDLKNMSHKFVEWMTNAYWTPHEEVFDIGITTRHALRRLENILNGRSYPCWLAGRPAGRAAGCHRRGPRNKRIFKNHNVS